MKPILAMLLLASCAFGQGRKDVSDENGTDWQGASDSFKTGYVMGYITAMGDAQIGIALTCAFQMHLKPESEEANACTTQAQKLNFGSITVGQFVEGMDAFYKDFRNTQYPMRAAMRIVRDQVNGRSAEDIEKELVSWRQCHADVSKCVTPASPKPTPPVTKAPPAK